MTILTELGPSKPMEFFPWIPIFEVGVEGIDEQHKKLVSLINNVCVCAIKGEDISQIINPLFNEIIAYTKYHFDYEEHFYEENNLLKPLLDSHKEKHSKVVSEILSLKEKYNIDVNKVEGLDEILTALVLWLTNHILREDMRMNIIISLLQNGVNIEKVEEAADIELEESKGSISNVMLSMTKVSNASFREIRRELSRRRALEKQLVREISIRKKTEEKLKHLSQHDALTGIPNRRLFEELCSASLLLAKRNKKEQAVLFVDIDGFKSVNDTLGHQAGDELLISIAKRLKKCVRDSDVVSRIGGDEFVIHLGDDCNDEDAKVIASKMVTAISTPFKLVDGTACVGASIGIAIYPSDADTAETLVKKADEAMYVAKKNGKNTHTLFSSL